MLRLRGYIRCIKDESDGKMLSVRAHRASLVLRGDWEDGLQVVVLGVPASHGQWEGDREE